MLHPLASNVDCMIRNVLGHKCASPDKICKSTSTRSEGWQSFETSSIDTSLAAVNRGEIAEG